MSLIHDYLKIQGHENRQNDTGAGIPPLLKRPEADKLQRSPLLLAAFGILCGILLVFLVFRIFAPPGGNEIIIAATDTAVREGPGTAPHDPDIPAHAETADMENEAAPPPVTQRISVEELPRYEEREKDVIAADGRKPQPAGIMPVKIVQPLQLEDPPRKITFPQETPAYTGPEEPASKAVAENVAAAQHELATAAGQLPPARTAPAASHRESRFYQAGLVAQRRGDYRTAETYYREALAAVPGHIDAMVNLSALYVQQERFYEAEEILAELLAREPANSKGLVNKGMVSLFLGRDAEAASFFEAALGVNPTEVNALINLIYLAEKNNDPVSAERYYRYLLRISPDNLEVLLAYGHLLEEQHRYEEALALYDDIRELDAVKRDRNLMSGITERMRVMAAMTAEGR